MLSFREYVKFRESNIPITSPNAPGADPITASKVQKQAKVDALSTRSSGKTAGEIINQAAMKVALRPGENPANVDKLFKSNKPTPGAPLGMMKKK